MHAGCIFDLHAAKCSQYKHFFVVVCEYVFCV